MRNSDARGSEASPPHTTRRRELTKEEIHAGLKAIGREIRPAWAGPRITRYDKLAVHADDADIHESLRPAVEPFNWDAKDVLDESLIENPYFKPGRDDS